MHANEYGTQIHRDKAIKIGDGDLVHRRQRLLDACVVEGSIQSAEPLNSRIERVLHVVLAAVGDKMVAAGVPIFGAYGGTETGNALVDILYGDVNPSGRLPYTIAKDVSDYGAQLLLGGGGNTILQDPYEDR